jgi:hypothetical protein
VGTGLAGERSGPVPRELRRPTTTDRGNEEFDLFVSG